MPDPSTSDPASSAPPATDPSAPPAADPSAPPAADPAPSADPGAAGGAPSNLQWEDGSGGAITTASTGDSVTASFDLAHQDSNQVTVNVLGSDQSTQIGTAAALERSDQTGFTAPWVVADGDGFCFQVTVTNPSVTPAPDPVTSGILTAGPPAPGPDYYYPPDEKPSFDYVVAVCPAPPADSGECNYHQGSESGTILKTDSLVTQGTGTLQVDLSTFHASSDSPLFLEFDFSKDGHENQGSVRAVALADPAPATIDVPADAKPGDTIQLQVTAWNAVVYDTPGTGTPKPESDATRISSDTQAAVKWKIGGNDVPDTGAQISYTIPSDATASIDVQAYLDVSSSFPAQGSIALGAGAAAGSGPVVQSIDPATGDPAGATAVTITGTGFTGATGATIGGNPLDQFQATSDTQITGNTPAGTAGAADVVVQGASGNSDPTAGGQGIFTYGGSSFWLHLVMDLATAQASGDQFVLTSDDNVFSQTLSPQGNANDQDDGDDTVELNFTGLDTTKSYSLQVTEPGADPYFIFQSVPYANLATWTGGDSSGSDPSDPSGSDPGVAGDTYDDPA